MKVDNPNAYRFIMEDEIYLLEQDKGVKQLTDTLVTISEAPSITSEQVAVKPQPVKQPVVETPAIAFNYLGNNNKNFLILVNYTTDEFIAPAHLTALENILKRKDIAIDDVAILNTRKYPQVAFADLNSYFNPKKLLIMGDSALPRGLSKPALNQLYKLNTTDALYSFSFGQMMESNDNKKAFWEQMKQL